MHAFRLLSGSEDELDFVQIISNNSRSRGRNIVVSVPIPK